MREPPRPAPVPTVTRPVRGARARLDTTVPFRRADARAAGITVRELRGPRFQKIFFDLYVSASVTVTAILRAKAALAISPSGSYASHETAAEMWGGIVPDQPQTHVSVPDGNRSERRGVFAHRAPADRRLSTVADVPLSSPVQTFLDLADRLSLLDLVVLGDSLVTRKRVRPEELVAGASVSRGRGARRARRAARLVRAGVDSAMETRLRMLIVLAGLPEPRVNLVLRDVDGNWVMRFDLSYPDLRLLIEYDGRQHITDDAQVDRDIVRREELDTLGWRIVIVRAKGIYQEPDQTLHRIAQARRERGAAQGSRSDEWRRYFPVRARA